MYIERNITEQFLSLSTQYPVIFLTGPRQSGKTTLAVHLFPEKSYFSLENPDTLEFALSDPRSFLSQSQKGMIIDEAQRAPKLFSYIQGIVDENKEPGAYILSGSQNFLLLEKISQSLAGRVAILRLLPFSYDEYLRQFDIANLEDIIIEGMYPPIHDRGLSKTVWFDQYISTYIERDVRSIKNIENLNTFQRFLKLCAGRSGQILNYSSLANDCGITHNTARSWVSILETSYIVSLLPPYYENFNKRLIKSPKLYFLDSGLLCYLMGINSAEIFAVHPLKGAVFETYIYGELLKLYYNAARRAELYFWRDKTGHEIDFIAPHADKIISIEVKAGKTINADYFKNLKYFASLAPSIEPIVIYNGDQEQIRSSAHVMPAGQAIRYFAKPTTSIT
ncbi:MAG: ATP-binding protein [Spirochaetaceae bacterium]